MRPASHTDTYYLVRRAVPAETWWTARAEDRRGIPCWVNRHGGMNPVKDDDEILDQCVVADELDCDMTRTSEYAYLAAGADDPARKLGWIDRSGRFYRCHWHEHDRLACVVIGKRPHDLETQGWVKVDFVHGLPHHVARDWSLDHPHRLSPEQARTLNREELELFDADIALG